MREKNMKSGFRKLKMMITSLLLLLMVLGTTLFSGCGMVEIVSETKADSGLVISTFGESEEEFIEDDQNSEDPEETDFVEETKEAILETVAAETEAAIIETEAPVKEPAAVVSVDKDGSYTSKEEVALYIHTYGKLPSNYITKKDAEALGWNSSKGNLWDVAKGKSIGGSYFGNYENKLPTKKGRKYYECDINYNGGYRGSERIIYSNDGLVFFTEDHYESFEQLY